jgi:hypothetical protein
MIGLHYVLGSNEKSNIQAVRFLLERGADVNACLSTV